MRPRLCLPPLRRGLGAPLPSQLTDWKLPWVPSGLQMAPAAVLVRERLWARTRQILGLLTVCEV